MSRVNIFASRQCFFSRVFWFKSLSLKAAKQRSVHKAHTQKKQTTVSHNTVRVLIQAFMLATGKGELYELSCYRGGDFVWAWTRHGQGVKKPRDRLRLHSIHSSYISFHQAVPAFCTPGPAHPAASSSHGPPHRDTCRCMGPRSQVSGALMLQSAQICLSSANREKDSEKKACNL